MLLQNQTLFAQYPVSRRGGFAADERTLYGRGNRFNIFVGEGLDNNKGSVPSGYLAPVAWILPIEAGGGNANGFAYASGVALGAIGLNGTADAIAISEGVAIGSAVSNGVATGSAASSGVAIGVATVNGIATGAAISSGTANASATASGTASGNATSSGAVIPYAIAWGTASNVSEGLTPDGIATSVWAALATDNDTAGTMGALLNASGAAGDPWAVTLEGTYTAAELMRIMASVLAGKVSGAGSGTETFRGVADLVDRVVSVNDAQGNRTAVTLDGA